MDSDSSEQQCKGLTKCDVTTAIILTSCPFVFAHYTSHCQDSNNSSSMPPKIEGGAFFSLAFLSPFTRPRRDNQGERRAAKGIEADPRRERWNKKKKTRDTEVSRFRYWGRHGKTIRVDALLKSCSIQYAIESKNRHHTTHSLRV